MISQRFSAVKLFFSQTCLAACRVKQNCRKVYNQIPTLVKEKGRPIWQPSYSILSGIFRKTYLYSFT